MAKSLDSSTDVEQRLCNSFFHHPDIQTSRIPYHHFPWDYALIINKARGSQYDLLISLCRKDLLHGLNLICHADSGEKFHGFKGRSWEAAPGNIHLSILLSPDREIPHYGTGFTILAAVSALETLKSVPALTRKLSIRWVNDIVAEESKICGVLAHTVSQGGKVLSAILGIGMNITVSPPIEKNIYTSSTICLNEIASRGYSSVDILPILIHKIEENYQYLVRNDYSSLFERYKSNSIILGRDVEIYEDLPGEERILAKGKVEDIGENLELYIKGYSSPITRGRPVILD